MYNEAMELTINWLAVAIATIFSVMLAIAWYNDGLFGKQWRKLTGVTAKDSEKAGNASMVIVVLANIVTVVALAVAIAITQAAFDNTSLWLALAVGLVAWAAFSASTLQTHNLFELKPPRLTTINNGYQLVFFVGAALIIGLM